MQDEITVWRLIIDPLKGWNSSDIWGKTLTNQNSVTEDKETQLHAWRKRRKKNNCWNFTQKHTFFHFVSEHGRVKQREIQMGLLNEGVEMPRVRENRGLRLVINPKRERKRENYVMRAPEIYTSNRISLRRRWVGNIRMDLQEVGCVYMDWIGLAQDRDRWRTLVNAVMILRVPWNAGNSLTSCKPVSFSRRNLHHGVSKRISLCDRTEVSGIGETCGTYGGKWIAQKPCFQTPSASFPHAMSKTKLHTHKNNRQNHSIEPLHT